MNQAPNGVTRPRSQFDLTTHRRDGKGKIVDENHYILHIDNGVHTFERPPGSGYFYDSANNLVREPELKEVYESVQGKSEFNQDDLLKQIEDLKAQISEQIQVQPVELAPPMPEVIDEKQGPEEKAPPVVFNKQNFIK